MWSHLGLNQGPPDYESGATNQLSYRTPRTRFLNTDVVTKLQHISKATAKVLQKNEMTKKKRKKYDFFV